MENQTTEPTPWPIEMPEKKMMRTATLREYFAGLALQGLLISRAMAVVSLKPEDVATASVNTLTPSLPNLKNRNEMEEEDNWISVKPNFEALKYCQKNIGNTGTCSCVATRQVKLCDKESVGRAVKIKERWEYRCEEHATTGTVNYVVYESNPLDQSWNLQKVNQWLRQFIGKEIKSKVHTAKGLIVKYLKDNGGVMCFQPVTKKYKFVYYNQITHVLTSEVTDFALK